MLKEFEIHVVRSGPQAVVRVCGDFDLASVPHWRDQVSSLLDDGVLDVAVDMAELDFIDSSAECTCRCPRHAARTRRPADAAFADAQCLEDSRDHRPHRPLWPGWDR